MRTVSLVLDIQTQSLDSLYTYIVPADMVGVKWLRRACRIRRARRAIGYVMEVCERPDSEIDPTSVSRLKPLLSVLSSPYFDEDGAALVNLSPMNTWRRSARVYICSLPWAVRRRS